MAANSTATRLSWWFAVAAVLAALATVVHAFAGGSEIMDPLFASNNPLASTAVLDVVWQQVTALLLGSTVVIGAAAFRAEWRRPVAYLIGGHFAVIAAIFLVLGWKWFQSPWPMPQWIFFVPIVALLFLGVRRIQRT